MTPIVIWDLDDDEEGNVQHIGEHGITIDEVEELFADRQLTVDYSRSSERPMIFGHTSTGKYIAVVFEIASDDPFMVYPVTAYEVPEPT